MDNNELALALREPDLEKVCSYFIKHIFNTPSRKGEDLSCSGSQEVERNNEDSR